MIRGLLWTGTALPLALMTAMWLKLYAFRPLDPATGKPIYVCGAAGAGCLCISTMFMALSAGCALALFVGRRRGMAGGARGSHPPPPAVPPTDIEDIPPRDTGAG